MEKIKPPSIHANITFDRKSRENYFKMLNVALNNLSIIDGQNKTHGDKISKKLKPNDY